VVRREFGATSLGAFFGLAAWLIAFATAAGPGLFGAVQDACGGYGPSLVLAGRGEPDCRGASGAATNCYYCPPDPAVPLRPTCDPAAPAFKGGKVSGNVRAAS
jgi:hypothetical protein